MREQQIIIDDPLSDVSLDMDATPEDLNSSMPLNDIITDAINAAAYESPTSKRIAEFVIDQLATAPFKTARTGREMELNLAGRKVYRDISPHLQFLGSKKYSSNGPREISRRLKQLERSKKK